jgi:hypothetical protein
MDKARRIVMTFPDALPQAGGKWRDIPWRVSIARALHDGARENKLIAMVVRSGHPLGCTCNNGIVDRASIEQNPDIASCLRTRFIPLAIDQHIHRRLAGDEGRLYAELVGSAGIPAGITTQGYYVLTSSAELVAYRHTQNQWEIRDMLLAALANHQPRASRNHARFGIQDFRFSPPEGIIVLDVVSRVLGGYTAASDHRELLLQSSQGLDHCWVREDEVACLSSGIVPDSLLDRIARFHLVDNTRGEPPCWRADQVRDIQATLQGGELTGSVSLGSEEGRRGYVASLSGRIVTSDGKLTDLDIMARGFAWGRGYHNAGAPRGRYPLAVRLTLAKGTLPFDSIPPGAARTRQREYLGIPAGAAFR